MTHPVRACTDPHLLCPQHDHPFYPRHQIEQPVHPTTGLVVPLRRPARCTTTRKDPDGLVQE